MIQPNKLAKHLPSNLFFPFPFVFLTIYFKLFADHILFFQEKSILFQASADYLFKTLHQPGKLLVFLGEFLTTFYYYPLAGSVLISGITVLIMIELSAITRILTGKSALLIPLLIGAVLFLLQTNYYYLLINSLGILLQITLFYFTIRYFKGWFPVIIAPVWFFITGGFSWIYFLMITFWFITYSGKLKWIKTALLWVVCLVMLYVSKEFLFFQPVKTLALFPFSTENAGSKNYLFFLAVALIACLPLIDRIKYRMPFRNRIPEYVGKYAVAFLFFSALVIIAVLFSDKKTNQYFRAEKLFFEGKMDALIDYNTKNPSNNILTNYLNNIALCEKGKLTDQLFHFRQSPDGQTLFLKWEIQGEILRLGGYFYYATGMINEAQRWAFEYMVMKGPTPEGLKMLIKTELINGNYKVASKYISLLKKSIFYRGDAKKYERMLLNEGTVDSDIELGAKRRNRIKKDFFTITDNPLINVERILVTDSLNRNALEYKMAWLLIKKDYRNIVGELPQLNNLNYNKIPVHLEEAALVYMTTYKQGMLPDPMNLAISRETRDRFQKFMTTFQQFNNDPRRAEPTLRKQFGNTFWYYAIYR